MSQNINTLLIIPPEHRRGDEKYTIKEVICPVCNGRCGFTEEVSRDVFQTDPCTYCDGAGKVKAEINIRWKPVHDIEKWKDGVYQITSPVHRFSSHMKVIEEYFKKHEVVTLEQVTQEFIRISSTYEFEDRELDIIIAGLMVELYCDRWNGH